MRNASPRPVVCLGDMGARVCTSRSVFELRALRAHDFLVPSPFRSQFLGTQLTYACIRQHFAGPEPPLAPPHLARLPAFAHVCGLGGDRSWPVGVRVPICGHTPRADPARLICDLGRAGGSCDGMSAGSVGLV